MSRFGVINDLIKFTQTKIVQLLIIMRVRDLVIRMRVCGSYCYSSMLITLRYLIINCRNYHLIPYNSSAPLDFIFFIGAHNCSKVGIDCFKVGFILLHKIIKFYAIICTNHTKTNFCYLYTYGN